VAEERMDPEGAVGGFESTTPPQNVFLDAVLRVVGDAEILGALFTTYSLDPCFFQDEVLARLMGQDSSMVRARRMLAREALGEVRPLVLYDSETVQGGQSIEGFRSDLPVHYIGVHHRTGAFHPKLSLLLTGPLPGSDTEEYAREAAGGDGPERLEPCRLVVVVASANLTASGWRRNVEVAWTGVVERGEACTFRDDLLGEHKDGQAGGKGLLDRLRTWCGPEGKATLDAMEAVVRASIVTQDLLPRLWHGQARLDRFLSHHLPAQDGVRKVELVAPFATDPRPIPVQRLIKAARATEATVRPPQDRDGEVSVSKAWVKAVGRLPTVRWGDFPKTVTTAGSGSAKGRAAARYTHAKLLHLREGKKGKRAGLLSGSPNLTIRGHAGVGPRESNVEIAVLEDVKGGSGQPWLELAADPTGAQQPDTPPEEPPTMNFAGVHLVVDWQQRILKVAVDAERVTRLRLYDSATGGDVFAKITLSGDSTAELAGEDVGPILQRLETQSVLWAEIKDFKREAVLVQEQGLLGKPDALSRELTPADILSIWATLEPYRRQVLLEDALRRTGTSGDGEADVFGQNGKQRGGKDRPLNLFERLTGQFFAFHIFKERLRRCFQQGRPKRAEVMVFGRAGNSVRSLVTRVLDQQDDMVERLVVLLCCKEVLEEVRRASPDMIETHRDLVGQFDQLLDESWAALQTPDMDRVALKTWVLENWPGLAP